MRFNAFAKRVEGDFEIILYNLSNLGKDKISERNFYSWAKWSYETYYKDVNGESEYSLEEYKKMLKLCLKHYGLMD